MTGLNLPGATVLVVQPGQRLVFVTTRTDYDPAQLDRTLRQLRRTFPGNEIHVVAGFDQVIAQEHEPNDIEATGQCCCNGCIGQGLCDLAEPEERAMSRWEADPDGVY